MSQIGNTFLKILFERPSRTVELWMSQIRRMKTTSEPMNKKTNYMSEGIRERNPLSLELKYGVVRGFVVAALMLAVLGLSAVDARSSDLFLNFGSGTNGTGLRRVIGDFFDNCCDAEFLETRDVASSDTGTIWVCV